MMTSFLLRPFGAGVGAGTCEGEGAGGIGSGTLLEGFRKALTVGRQEGLQAQTDSPKAVNVNALLKKNDAILFMIAFLENQVGICQYKATDCGRKGKRASTHFLPVIRKTFFKTIRWGSVTDDRPEIRCGITRAKSVYALWSAHHSNAAAKSHW